MVQAALSGYSDLAMRRLAREYGCPYTVNEVVLDRFIDEGGKKMRRMLAIDPDEHPVGGQLMGSEPAQFARAAAGMIQLGYDVIDVNFGCPVKKVLGRCRGGYLLSEPDTAKEILRRVHEAVAGRAPVTVKMRRGMDDSDESERNFFTILETAFDLGYAAATVHGRTVTQRYVGPSRWSFLAKVKRHVGNCTILGSGDLFTAEDCARMLEETGVDAVSIARGAIGNPFIFREVRALLDDKSASHTLHKQRFDAMPPPSISEQRTAIERHFELMSPMYGEQKACVLFRKFGVRYAELHPCHRDVKMAYVAVKAPDDFKRLLDEWYGEQSAYPPVTRRSRPEALVAAGATMDCAS